MGLALMAAADTERDTHMGNAPAILTAAPEQREILRMALADAQLAGTHWRGAPRVPDHPQPGP